MAQQPGVAEHLVAWLHDKWGDGKACPMCGNVTWNVSGVGGLLSWKPPSGITFGHAYLVAPVNCTNCGFVAFISAAAAGLREIAGQEAQR